MAKSGSLSINSENIFPIIKKWLYSDHDIFYRELVSWENRGETEGENTTSEGKYWAASVAAAALFRILELTVTVSSTG